MIKKILFITILTTLVNSTTLDSYSQSSEQLKEAISLINKKINLDKAYNLLLQSSKAGNLNATYTLGKFYLSKITPYYDKINAYNTLLKAANANHSKSQLIIGKFFLQGKIVEKDYEKAMYYFKEASKQKLYDANCYIAYMYATGKGVFPNFGRAAVFAKDEYKKGNKLCKKIWKDYNLDKYPQDKSWKIGDYLKPVK